MNNSFGFFCVMRFDLATIAWRPRAFDFCTKGRGGKSLKRGFLFLPFFFLPSSLSSSTNPVILHFCDPHGYVSSYFAFAPGANRGTLIPSTHPKAFPIYHTSSFFPPYLAGSYWPTFPPVEKWCLRPTFCRARKG